MTLSRKSTNRYEIEKSALFRLSSVRALGAALQWEGTPSALRALSRRPDNFHQYPKKNPVTGKIRLIQAPNPQVKPLQKRLNTLLKQLIVPPYLQSGIPGRSHLSNSSKHLAADGATATVDISDFYPSISRKRIFRLFRNVFECEPDIADVLADLVCFDGHLATGSPASVLLSFFAFRDLFDKIAIRAQASDATFTLYIDDIAITGATIGHSDVKFLGSIFQKYGLQSKEQKARVFRANQAKVVTGRAFRNGISRAPNSRHQSMHEALKELQNGSVSTKKIRSAIGKVEHVGLLDDQRAVGLKKQAKRIRATLPPVKSRPRKKAVTRAPNSP